MLVSFFLYIHAAFTRTYVVQEHPESIDFLTIWHLFFILSLQVT